MTAPSPMLTFCACSHTQRRHQDNEGFCEAAGCGCVEFRPADQQPDMTPAPEPHQSAPVEEPRMPAPREDSRQRVQRILDDTFRAAREKDTRPIAAAVRPSPVPTRPATAPRPPAPLDPQVKSIFDRAAVSSKRTTRTLGERVRAQLKRLREIVEAEEKAAELDQAERARRAQVEQETRERIQKLEADLAEQREKLSRIRDRSKPQGKRATRGTPQTCPVCGQRTANLPGLQSHMRSKHPGHTA